MASVLKKLPVPQGLKKAVLYDAKPSGTSAGAFTAGAWRTRELNTIEGDTDIVSLSSNQFTLTGGSYYIYATAPGRAVDSHQTRLYNVTNSSVSLKGTSAESGSGVDCIYSHVAGVIEIGSPSIFELQHICQSTNATGFGGQAGLSNGSPEKFANVVILKL